MTIYELVREMRARVEGHDWRDLSSKIPDFYTEEEARNYVRKHPHHFLSLSLREILKGPRLDSNINKKSLLDEGLE